MKRYIVIRLNGITYDSDYDVLYYDDNRVKAFNVFENYEQMNTLYFEINGYDFVEYSKQFIIFVIDLKSYRNKLLPIEYRMKEIIRKQNIKDILK